MTHCMSRLISSVPPLPSLDADSTAISTKLIFTIPSAHKLTGIPSNSIDVNSIIRYM